MPDCMSMGACSMSAVISVVIICTAAGRRVGNAWASPCTSMLTICAAAETSCGRLPVTPLIRASRMFDPVWIMPGSTAEIFAMPSVIMVGSSANRLLICTNNCPPMLWSSMPSPATRAAMMAPMPRNFRKLPGLKKLPNMPPILPRPACTFGPTMSPRPPNMSPRPDRAGVAAVLTLPASAVNPVASFESPILEITPPNPLESFVPNASRLLSAALASLPNPLVSFDPHAVTDWPMSVPAIFEPNDLNGPVSLSVPWVMRLRALANGSPSTARASRRSLLKYDLNWCRPVRLDWSWPGICLSFPVSWPNPPSPILPSVSNTLVILSTLPPTPANRANAPASWPTCPTMSWMVMLPSCSPFANRSIRPIALSM